MFREELQEYSKLLKSNVLSESPPGKSEMTHFDQNFGGFSHPLYFLPGGIQNEHKSVKYRRAVMDESGVAAVRHKSGATSFTYHVMASLLPDSARFESEGTVFGFTNKQNFENLRFVIPPPEIVAAYEVVANPLDEQIRTLVRHPYPRHPARLVASATSERHSANQQSNRTTP